MKLLSIVIPLFLLSLNTAFGGTIVMVTSDYQTGNTAVYDTETGVFSDNVLPVHQDSRVKTDGTYLYILEGFGADAVSKYHPSSIKKGNEIYQYSVGANANPIDMIFTGSKAYVLLYNSDKIWIIDPGAEDEASFKKGEIDVSQWADADGSPEANLGFVYDGMVYVVLQRYDASKFTAGTAVLIRIDPSTDTIVDMDETAEGIQGIDLIIKNPAAGALAGSTLYLSGTTYGVSDEGVMKVDLDDPENSQKKIISEEAAGGNISGVDVFDGGLGLVYSYDENWNVVPQIFDTGDGTLSAMYPDISDAGGGAVMANGLLYLGTRDYENPGMFITSPYTDESPAMREYFATELPPYSIIYVGNGTPSAVAGPENVPETFSIEAAYPNPFNPATTVSFNLALPAVVRVDVFNSAGQKIETLANSFMSAGSHSIFWNATFMSSGMYYISVCDGVTVKSSKVTLVK